MAGGVAALLKAERTLLLHITPLHKNKLTKSVFLLINSGQKKLHLTFEVFADE